MAVYYKFKSAKDYDSIPIDGQFISVGSLKERIFESKHLGRGTDFDLMISNAQSNEEYVDEAAMIPKNTSVLIRRVPGCPRKPIVTEPDEPKLTDAVELPPQTGMLVGDSSTTMKYAEDSEWDEFGNDLYAIPEVSPTQLGNPGVDASAASKIDEENKIKALVETPALDWSRQGQDGFGGGRGFGRGMGGRMMAGRGFGRGGFERKTPPVGYICHRCKVPGHFIQHCPTNGDPNYDIRKVKPPTGIPRSMLMATPDGSYALPSGAVAVLKPNEAAFEKEIEGMPSTSTRPVSDLPPELRCPLCKEVMKDAVLTSKCCFRSFCDKCIRDYIISKSMCVCGATNILADDLLPNKTLRETISRILESTSSTENVGSLVHIQDMESAHQVPPKIPSPTRSAASRDEPKQISLVQQYSDVKVGNGKEADAVSEGKAINDRVPSLDNKAVKNTDQSEAMPESMNAKEPISPESVPVPEDGQEKLVGGDQGKKKKKKKARVPGSDMQWRGFQDLGAENYAVMPPGPAAYNPYWGGGMPMGIDGFMTPFGGAMPYVGYAPGPFDVPFGGMLQPDPFAAQGYMMPPLPPRDLSELGFNSMNMKKAPPMSREEFEAMKADIRRKREFERRNERDRHSRDGRGAGKEVGSSGADVSPVKAKPRLMSKADRHDRPERTSDPDRPRESSRHSPPPIPRPSSKRWSSGHDERERNEEDKAAAEQPCKSDRKQKVSVFSRISFPDSEKEAKKRKTSSSSDAAAAAAANGVVKDHHHHHHHRSNHRDRDEAVSHRASSVSSNGYKRSSYEHESSEEEEDEDYHFKRRPSRREREREDEGRSSRTMRERDRDRSHETKRR